MKSEIRGEGCQLLRTVHAKFIIFKWRGLKNMKTADVMYASLS